MEPTSEIKGTEPVVVADEGTVTSTESVELPEQNTEDNG